MNIILWADCEVLKAFWFVDGDTETIKFSFSSNFGFKSSSELHGSFPLILRHQRAQLDNKSQTPPTTDSTRIPIGPHHLNPCPFNQKPRPLPTTVGYYGWWKAPVLRLHAESARAQEGWICRRKYNTIAGLITLSSYLIFWPRLLLVS